MHRPSDGRAESHTLAASDRTNVRKVRWDRRTDGHTPGHCFTLTAVDAANVTTHTPIDQKNR